MRLTLRTLLAYLDDRLSPTNARELGQKVAKSPFATELAERIKSVVRRRRLAKESMEHKAIDANLIAEYLDDQLTPELIALIEKEILASDLSLAEVAATHQILGLLSDPVEIGEELRERLYALGPVAEGDASEKDSSVSPAANEAAEGWQPLERPTEKQTRSPMILLVVMVVGWLILLATDSNIFESDSQVVSTPGEEPVLADLDERENEENPQQGAPAETKATSSQQGDSNVVADNNNDSAPDADTGELATPDSGEEKPADASSEGTAPMPVVSSENKVTDTQADPENENPKPPAPEVVERLELLDDHQILALQDSEDQTWMWASNAVEPGTDWMTQLSDRFASVSAPFSVRLIAPKSGWEVEIVGPATFSVAGKSSGALRVLEGRLLIRGYAAQAESPLTLVVGGQSIAVAVPPKGKVVAAEVVPISSGPALDGVAAEEMNLLPLNNNSVVRVTAVDSDAGLIPEGLDEPLQLPRGTTWQWTTTGAVTAEGQTAQQSMIPEWIYEQATPPSDLESDLRTTISSGYRKTESVSSAALTLTEDRNPRVASFAVGQLALVRNADLLIGVLLKSDESTTRQQAIASLQQMLHQTPAGLSKIQSALDTRLPEVEQENIVKLISGVGPVAAEDRQESAWLVDMLENSRVATRELAIFNLESLFGDRKGFFASDDPARRSRAVTRWRAVLRDNDGRLIVPGAEPESN